MKKWLTAILFGAVLVLGACGGGDNNGNNNSTEAHPAEEIYKKSCASCHGSDLGGGAGPGLEDVGSQYSADEIADIIENGAPGMPAGLVSGDDQTVLAEWLADKK